MKILLGNTELLTAWLKTPAACRSALLERREQARHINFDTVDGFHFANETHCYIRALIDARILREPEGVLIYTVVTGEDEI